MAGRFYMQIWVVLLLLLILVPLNVEAEDKAINVELVSDTRQFGWVTGDAIELQYLVTLPPSYEVVTSELPKTGQLNYWLDLATINVEHLSSTDESESYIVSFHYQTFYAPLDVRALTIPALSIVVSNGPEHQEVLIPEWHFMMSPLKSTVPIDSRTSQGQTFLMMPDHEQSIRATSSLMIQVSIYTVIVFSLLALWLYCNGLIFNKTTSPFLAAYRFIKRCAAKKEHTRNDFQQALQCTHHAFDSVAGYTVFLHKIDAFVNRFPEYKAHSKKIREFYIYSNNAFYQQDSGLRYDFDLLMSLCKDMANAEKITLGR